MSTTTNVRPSAPSAAHAAHRVNPIGASWSIAMVELRRFLSDKVALFSTVILPTVLVFVIGFSLGGRPDSLPVGVIDLDGSAQSEQFVDALQSQALEAVIYDDPQTLARDIRLGQLAAGVQVPEGFGQTLDSGQGSTSLTLSIDQASSNGTAVSTSILAVARELAEQPTAVRVTTQALDASPEQADTIAGIAQQASAEAPPVQTDVTILGTVRPDEENQFARAVPTQLVLFVFLNGMLAAQTIVDSRRLGVSRRMLSTPTGIGPHILGIGISRLLLGLMQSAILLLVGRLWFGVDFGDPLSIGVLVLIWAALAAAVGMLVGAIAKNPDQVVAIGVPLGIGFGMLGGSMWPLSIVPGFMQVVGHVVPHGWANDAWSVVINDGGAVGDIGREIVILVAFTVAIAGLAVVLLRRSLSR